MKFLPFSFCILFGFSALAEEVYHPELQNLMEADLVVDANFKSQSKDHFFIIVNEVIKDNGFGIVAGDQIKLKREDNGCGQIVDFSYYKRQRFYLTKKPNSWRLNYGSTQSVQSVYHFAGVQAADSFCGLSFVPPHGKERQTMNQFIVDFLGTYEYQDSSNRFILGIDSADLQKIISKNPLVAAFEKRGRCCLDGSEELVEIEVEPEHLSSEENLPLIACQFLDEIPKPLLTDSQLKVLLNENINPLSNMGVEGRVILQLNLHIDGTVDSVLVKRGIHPVLDSIAIEKALGMGPWSAGIDGRGRGRSCFTMLPFRFKI